MSKNNGPPPRRLTRITKAPVLEEVKEVDDADLDEIPSGTGVLKQMPWSMKIEHLETEIPITAAKLPNFTSGMLDSGDLAVETLNMPALSFNHYFRTWLRTPKPRMVELHALTTLGESVERWKMALIPIAMGFSEFDTTEEDLWTTQIAFSASDIEIIPTSKVK